MTFLSKHNYMKSLLIAISLGLGGFLLWALQPTPDDFLQKKLRRNLEHRVQISNSIRNSVKKSQFPTQAELTIGSKQGNFHVAYTLDPKLQLEAENLLKSYKPDYGAIFMMDAKTGQVLAMASFDKGDSDADHMALKASYPAASVFKIVTATTAIDRAGVSPGHSISFNGGNYTLYRKNVMSEKINRWTRTITLRDAFARSINTAFGRLSLQNFEPTDLNEYANRFMFNQVIPSDFPIDMSIATVPAEKNFAFTEVASGYNKLNRMSPVHGAMIAGSIVNDGKMVIPYLIDEISDSDGLQIYKGETLEKGQIMTEASALKVKELMEQTILSGTSRKSFRSLVKNKNFREIEMGGKTGHLTGDNPKGRVDWFVGYALDDTRKISLAAVTVNVKYWTVKSAHLGQSMFKKYFDPPVIRKRVALSQ